MFEITIKETKQVKKLTGKEWKVIGTEEVRRDPSYYQHDKNEPRTRITEVSGYTPEIEKVVEVEVVVFTQKVDSMNLASVIKAINGLQ